MAAAVLDMALDDIIKQKQADRGAGRGGRGGRSNRGRGASGPVRKARPTARKSAPYARPVNTKGMYADQEDDKWQHDRYEGPPRGSVRDRLGAKGAASLETGCKLLIENLNFGVSTQDIQDLFEEIGDVKRAEVHYDRSGRSKGTAEVVYARKADALTAIEKYNNVPLDDFPLKIRLAPTTFAAAARPVNVGRRMKEQRSVVVSVGRSRGRARRGASAAVARASTSAEASSSSARGGRGRGRGGRGRGRARGPAPTKEDLDADLESYKNSTEVMDD